MTDLPPPYTSTRANSTSPSDDNVPGILTPTESIVGDLPPYELPTVPVRSLSVNTSPSSPTFSPQSSTRISSPEDSVEPSPPRNRVAPAFPSAAAYFEDRQTFFQPHGERLTCSIAITPASTPATIPFPQPEYAWLARNVNYEDFATFLNYLFSDSLTSLADLVEEKDQRIRERFEPRAAFYGHERQAAIDAVVAEWNEGFFNPRGLRVETVLTVAPPGYNSSIIQELEDNRAETTQYSRRQTSNRVNSPSYRENGADPQVAWLGFNPLRQVVRFAEAARRRSESGRDNEQRCGQPSSSQNLAPSTASPQELSALPDGSSSPDEQAPRRLLTSLRSQNTCSRASKPSKSSKAGKPLKPSKPSRRDSVSSYSSPSSSSSRSSISSSGYKGLDNVYLDYLTQQLANIHLQGPLSKQEIANAIRGLYQGYCNRPDRHPCDGSRRYTKQELHAAKRALHDVMKDAKEKLKAEKRRHKEAQKLERTCRKAVRYELGKAQRSEEWDERYERYRMHAALYEEQEELYKLFREQYPERKRQRHAAKVARKEAKNAAKKERKAIKRQVKEASKEIFS